MKKNRLAGKFIEAFKNSKYSRRSFTYEDENLFVHIRIPPIVPKEIIEKQLGLRKAYSSCPAIENIQLSEDLRGEGFFKFLVDQMLSQPDIICVCITNVHNENFQKHLERDPDWKKLILPEGPLVKVEQNCFYRMSKM